MSEQKPPSVEITNQALVELRSRLTPQLPEMVIGEAEEKINAKTYIFHISRPTFILCIDREDGRVVPFEPQGELTITAYDRDFSEFYIQRAIRFAMVNGIDVQRKKIVFNERLPKFVFVRDVGPWTGVVRTEYPRFIAKGDGTQTLPFDTCEDLSPFLREAGKWYANQL